MEYFLNFEKVGFARNCAWMALHPFGHKQLPCPCNFGRIWWNQLLKVAIGKHLLQTWLPPPAPPSEVRTLALRLSGLFPSATQEVPCPLCKSRVPYPAQGSTGFWRQSCTTVALQCSEQAVQSAERPGLSLHNYILLWGLHSIFGTHPPFPRGCICT